tara:strand:- start:8455 stop:9027 length:573 start_codon:yes stop_codon:yes gene_type:complete
MKYFYKIISKILAIEFIAKFIIKQFANQHPDFAILDENGVPYLERWWVFNRHPVSGETLSKGWGWTRFFPFSIRVHRFRSPDKDEHFHDHPWDAVSLIFAGSYVEKRTDLRMNPIAKTPYDYTLPYFLESGDVNFIKANDFHSIVKVTPDDAIDSLGVWTVFINFKKKKSWGFMMEDWSIVNWTKYLKID